LEKAFQSKKCWLKQNKYLPQANLYSICGNQTVNLFTTEKTDFNVDLNWLLIYYIDTKHTNMLQSEIQHNSTFGWEKLFRFSAILSGLYIKLCFERFNSGIKFIFVELTICFCSVEYEEKFSYDFFGCWICQEPSFLFN